MDKVIPGRFTAQIDGPFIVLRLGIRINNFLMFWKWIPTLMVTVPLLRASLRCRAPGYLGGFNILYWSAGIGVIQYWRSYEDLEKFAESSDNAFLELWRHYNKSTGSKGSVGLWYEMFPVESSCYEVVYDNMPIIGLAAASEHVPAVGRRETARRRLGGESMPAVPSPANPVVYPETSVTSKTSKTSATVNPGAL